jgi:hypothetical protein
MSSIGGINGSDQSITQLLQRLARQRTGEDNLSVTSFGRSGEPPRAGFENRFGDALQAIGVSDDEVTAIQDDLKTAISEAMKDADSSTDVRATIQSVVDQTLEEHGVDADALKSQLESTMGGPPPMGGMPPGGAMPPGNGMPPGMEDALQEMGVDDEEISLIQEEIQSAIDQLTEDSEDAESTDLRDAVRSVVDETLQKHGVDTEELKSLMGPPPGGPGMMGASTASQSNEGILAQLGYSGATGDSSDQLLLSLLPLLDEQA